MGSVRNAKVNKGIGRMQGSQIKTKARVREHGEVYTNEREVKAMCDLIPQEVWDNIESTFLEPTCGNGNFLVEIFARKLERCKNERDGLKALASIVGLDILDDNITESRNRLKDIYLSKYPNANGTCLVLLDTILLNNFRCCDSLEQMQQWIDENANEIINENTEEEKK